MKKQTQILDGKSLAEKIKIDLAESIRRLDRKPGLAAVLVGDNEASKTYIKAKEKACGEVDIIFHKYLCNDDCCEKVTEEELLGLINFLNDDDEVDGIIVQLPLPAGLNQQKIIDAVDPSKDVDGFRCRNKKIIPPTIAAIMELLRATNADLKDRKTLIIGQSDVFISGLGKYLKKNLGIKKTKAEKSIPKNSVAYDIIIIALGRPRALRVEQVKPGAIIIDVGINKVDGQTVGDVDESAHENAGFFSPVPGGVGPLTVACLLRNTYLLSKSK